MKKKRKIKKKKKSRSFYPCRLVQQALPPRRGTHKATVVYKQRRVSWAARRVSRVVTSVFCRMLQVLFKYSTFCFVICSSSVMQRLQWNTPRRPSLQTQDVCMRRPLGCGWAVQTESRSSKGRKKKKKKENIFIKLYKKKDGKEKIISYLGGADPSMNFSRVLGRGDKSSSSP